MTARTSRASERTSEHRAAVLVGKGRSKTRRALRLLSMGRHGRAKAELLVRVREQRAAGNREAALDLSRNLVLLDARSPEVWKMYAKVLCEAEKAGEALEATRFTLDLDPSDVDSFEMFLDLGSAIGVRKRERARRTSKFAEHVVRRPERMVDAFDYAVAFQLDNVLDAMVESSVPMARALATLNQDAQQSMSDNELRMRAADIAAQEQVDHELLLLRVALARGRYSLIRQLYREVDPGALPLDALRRRIRRYRRNDELVRARPLINAFLRGKPGDSWAIGLLHKAQQDRRVITAARERDRILMHGMPPIVSSSARCDADASRVLYLLHNSLPYDSGGYATRTQGLLAALRGRGWDIQGVTRPGYPHDRHQGLPASIVTLDRVDGVPYHRLSTVSERLPRQPFLPYVDLYRERLVEMAAQLRPAAIHAASNHWNGIAAVYTAKELGIPAIYEVRGLWEVTRASREPDWLESPEYRFQESMEAYAAMEADRVMVLTQAIKRVMVSRGVDESKITVLPNGVDCTRFEPREPDDGLRRELAIPQVPVIGYVGSVVDYEGLDVLLMAARLLDDRQVPFHILVVGDGPALAPLHKIAESDMLDTKVTFTGRVPHESVERYHSLIDIMVCPRRSMPVTEMVSPLKPFEAMATKKPVVAANVDAIAEFIVDGVTGMLFQKDDPRSLADVLQEAISNTAWTAKVASAGYAWVRQERTWPKMAGIVDQTYRDLGLSAGRASEDSSWTIEEPADRTQMSPPAELISQAAPGGRG